MCTVSNADRLQRLQFLPRRCRQVSLLLRLPHVSRSAQDVLGRCAWTTRMKHSNQATTSGSGRSSSPVGLSSSARNSTNRAVWREKMAPQLINCSTSVAAILEEARGAESRRDFISKCSIGLKEARESHVRLRVCHRAALGPPGEAAALVDEARQIASIIGAIVRNSRRNAGITIGPVSRPNSPGAQSL